MLWHYKQESSLFRCWAGGRNVLFEPALFNSGAACAQHALSPRAGPGTVWSWRGHVRRGATGSGSWHPHPWHNLLPFGGVGADTGLMGSTRQTGAYQTACDHNQQWQRTMNAIIYKKTVQVSFSLSLLRLFTPTLLLRGSMEGLWTCRYSRQQDFFILPRATLLFMLHRHQAWSGFSCSLFPTNCTFQARETDQTWAVKLCAGEEIYKTAWKWICFSLGAVLR